MTPEAHQKASELLSQIKAIQSAIHYWTEVIKSPQEWLRKGDAAQPRSAYEYPDYAFPAQATPTEDEFSSLKTAVLKRLRREYERLKTEFAEL
ncbi:hypothetical protein GFB49_11570 [Epibacterium sp. SM1979]|uniref:Uncharacterized protein n=1 Tax=Tritonibacter litoralis TaxID=2662264 RepID=A0A843YHE9_9RHOB|nr:hypothetical protein [Tritonibacter litoralis]MQQ09095.1 hypothetical protein [Tritonibacter litoralis]